MVKKRLSFISAKKVLTPQEYAEYKEQRQIKARSKFKQQIEENRYSGITPENYARQEKYNKSRTGRFSNFLTRTAKTVRRPGGITRATYGQYASTQSSSLKGIKGSRGRPVGSVKYVDPRTGRPVGVYEFRKILALQRHEAIARQNLNPQQQAALERIRQNEIQRKMNPESNVFPDTYGTFDLDSIFRDIDSASNLVA